MVVRHHIKNMKIEKKRKLSPAVILAVPRRIRRAVRCPPTAMKKTLTSAGTFDRNMLRASAGTYWGPVFQWMILVPESARNEDM